MSQQLWGFKSRSAGAVFPSAAPLRSFLTSCTFHSILLLAAPVTGQCKLIKKRRAAKKYFTKQPSRADLLSLLSLLCSHVYSVTISYHCVSACPQQNHLWPHLFCPSAKLLCCILVPQKNAQLTPLWVHEWEQTQLTPESRLRSKGHCVLVCRYGF